MPGPDHVYVGVPKPPVVVPVSEIVPPLQIPVLDGDTVTLEIAGCAAITTDAAVA
jgi:hypothetical protein